MTGRDGTASTRAGYDAVASDYAAEVGGELAGKPFDRAVLDSIARRTAGGTVLDAGCGPGHVGAYLAAQGTHVVGLDLSKAMCRLAPRSVPCCCGDLTALPFRGATLRAVVSFYAVIHLDAAQRAQAYREIARVLEPGGRATIAFHVSSAEVATGNSIELTQWWGHDVALTFRFLDPAAEIVSLQDAGLALVDRADRDPYPGVEHPSRRSYLTVARRG